MQTIIYMVCVKPIMEYVQKNITIKKEHLDWIEKYSINLSRFVQKKIDERMVE